VLLCCGLSFGIAMPAYNRTLERFLHTRLNGNVLKTFRIRAESNINGMSLVISIPHIKFSTTYQYVRLEKHA